MSECRVAASNSFFQLCTNLDVMGKFLSTLGLDLETKESIEGLEISVKELMQTWVRQQYLRHSKETIGDTTVFKYEWGFRTHHEFSKEDALDMVSKIYGVPPRSWRTQFKEVEVEKAAALANESLDD